MRITVLSVVTLFVLNSSYAQFGDRFKNGLRYYLDTNDSARFIALNMTSQMWLRYTETNPYTAVHGTAESGITDFSIRRLRFVLSGQLTDRVSFYVQFGQNNLNYLSSRKTGAFFHDITTDYAFIKKKFIVGFGLNGWNGPSRFSNISTSSIMVLDPPGYQEVTNDTYDQFVRRLGVYAKGKLGKLDYRVSLAKPFVIQTASGSGTEAIHTNATFSTLPPKLVTQGYLMYQFLDQESNFGSGNTGTYLGKKKVLNLGAGFVFQKNAMFHYAMASQDTIMQNLKLVAFDLFYDSPLNEASGTAISVYACLSSYNFGKNFIKVSGSDNPATGSKTESNNSFDKANYGNAFPYLGTGNIGYLQIGYKFKDNLLGAFGTLQPYINGQYANYDRLGSPMYVYDIGFNWLIAGHHSKFTFDYQNRPYFATDLNGDVKEVSRKGQFVIQYQVAF